MGMRNAFDSLDHTVLLNKLYSYGFGGPIFELIEGFLSSRWQFVEVKKLKHIINQVQQAFLKNLFSDRTFCLLTSTNKQVILKITIR